MFCSLAIRPGVYSLSKAFATPLSPDQGRKWEGTMFLEYGKWDGVGIWNMEYWMDLEYGILGKKNRQCEQNIVVLFYFKIITPIVL